MTHHDRTPRLPDAIHHGQICGCDHPAVPPAPIGRPQIQISTGGILAIAVGGTVLVVTVGVILTSLLLAVAIVAGSLAVIALALAITARTLTTQQPNTDRNQR